MANAERTRMPRTEFAGRLDALDGLRTVAVLMVFVAHAAVALMRGGSVGVDLFFVISGFVITLLIVREFERTGSIRFGRFYINRLARLWPALLVMAAAVALTSVFFGRANGTELGPAVEASLYLFDFERAFGWFDAATSTAFGHTWSLAVEEQFYLVWPILLFALARLWGLKGAAIGAYVLALLPTVLRALLWNGGQGLNRIYNMPDTRADELLIGCALALTLTLRKGRAGGLQRALSAAIWPAAALLAVFAFTVPEAFLTGVAGTLLWTIGILVIALVAGALIAGVSTTPAHPLSRALASKWMSWPGRHLTYGFYLWHYPFVLAFFGLHLPERFALAFVCSVAAAYVSSRFVEEPIRRRIRVAADHRAARSTPTFDGLAAEPETPLPQ